MLDLELISHFQRLLKGIQVDEERIAEELICQVAPDGTRILDIEHTLKYFCEELWSPELMDRGVVSAWIKGPKIRVENARDKAKRLL